MSGGFDGKIFIYEGKESELIGEIQESGGKNAHGGGIYAVSWCNTSRSFLSCSGDKTCKIWDVETKKATTTFNLGNAVEDQQLGCLWSGNYMISVSLSGHINYLDPRTPEKPVKVVSGHNKPITKMIKGNWIDIFLSWFIFELNAFKVALFLDRDLWLFFYGLFIRNIW